MEIVFCVNGMLSWPMRVLDSNVTCLAFKILVPVGSGDVRAAVVRHDFICCVLGDYVSCHANVSLVVPATLLKYL